MASFSVPATSSSSFSITLATLKDRIRRALARENLVEYDKQWTSNQTDQAIQAALDWCRPVGVRSSLMATAGSGSAASATWTVDARLMRLDGLSVSGMFSGFAVQQEIPVGTIEQAMAPDGTAMLVFPQIIPSGSQVQAIGLWQYALPIDDDDLLPWPYLDLLVAASVAELYRLDLRSGMQGDQVEFGAAEQNWRMHATSLKMDIMSTLGFQPPEEEKKSSSRDKRSK